MLCIQAALYGFTGSSEMLVFHTLSAGNIGQLGAPGTVVPVTALIAAGADTDGAADECDADGDALGRRECAAEILGVEAWCAGREAAVVAAPAEQPALAAVIAIRAAAADVRAVRLVTCDVTGIIVASWHGPGGRCGDLVKSAYAPAVSRRVSRPWP
jgi:hypothetical protein